jgi:hypothetical protein
MREIRTLRATWRGLETWNGRITMAAGAPVLDPTDEGEQETGLNRCRACSLLYGRAHPWPCLLLAPVFQDAEIVRVATASAV